jgi:hypothetical protein
MNQMQRATDNEMAKAYMSVVARALIISCAVSIIALCAMTHANAQASVALYCWNPNGSQATNNQYVPCQASTPLQVSVGPSSAGGVAPSPLAPALATSQIIKGSAGNLYSFEVSVDSTLSAAAWWILIYDALADPGNGTVAPRKCYAQVSGATSASYAWLNPIHFTTGIVIVVSTTGCFTETQSAHAFISGDAQ